MVFRRRKGQPANSTVTASDLPDTDAGQDAVEQDEIDEPDESDPTDAPLTSGPWDVEDVPDSDVPRLDLGGLHVPTLPDVEVRLDTDPAGAVVSVLLVAGASALRLGAFAAPRRAGIWDDVRGELLETLRADGKSEERDGPFGAELLGTVPGERGKQTARYVGVDGPRWLLRGVFTGPAATDPAQAATLERAMREVVVVRGGDALPVRDPLPMALPAEIIEQAAEAAEDSRSVPGVPKRGPEITEIG